MHEAQLSNGVKYKFLQNNLDLQINDNSKYTS